MQGSLGDLPRLTQHFEVRQSQRNGGRFVKQTLAAVALFTSHVRMTAVLAPMLHATKLFVKQLRCSNRAFEAKAVRVSADRRVRD